MKPIYTVQTVFNNFTINRNFINILVLDEPIKKSNSLKRKITLDDIPVDKDLSTREELNTSANQPLK